MYVEAKKDIYGVLKVSLLFWVKISKILEEMGYYRNEYNCCVMNNIINNKQCTILYHIDDLRKSHFDHAVVSRVLADINAEYGRISKMTITWGKVHKYLGMNIDYYSLGKLIFSMIEYIGKMIEDIPEYIKGGSATTTVEHLFYIVEDATEISQSNSDRFHNL